jgi:hypothetical protein
MNVKNFLLNGIATAIQFGKNGGWLKWLNGSFKATATDGTTLVRVKGAKGVDSDDFATIAQLNAKGSLIVTEAFDAFVGVPAVVEGKVIYCTFTSGDHFEGKLYRGVDGVWVEVALTDGQPIVFTVDAASHDALVQLIDGSTSQFFEANKTYIWDADTSRYFDMTPSTSAGGTKVAKAELTGNTGTFEAPVKAGDVITRVAVHIPTAFVADFTFLSVVADTSVGLLAAADVDFLSVGVSEVSPYYVVESDGVIFVTWENTVDTTGVTVFIEYGA